MRHLILLLVTATAGCQAVKDKATDYLSEVAVDQITRAVDKKLEDRGLSVAQLKTLADSDKDGGVTPSEVTALVKSTALDLVELKATQISDQSKADLEQRIKALAQVKDVEELRAAADTHLKGGALSVFGLVVAALVNRIFSANKHAKTKEELAVARAETNARLTAFEKLIGRDLNNDGVIGDGNGGNGGGNGGTA